MINPRDEWINAIFTSVKHPSGLETPVKLHPPGKKRKTEKQFLFLRTPK